MGVSLVTTESHWEPDAIVSTNRFNTMSDVKRRIFKCWALAAHQEAEPQASLREVVVTIRLEEPRVLQGKHSFTMTRDVATLL